MAEEQTNEPTPTEPPPFTVTLPDGVTLDPAVVQEWQAHFRAAGVSQQDVDAIVGWHHRLTAAQAQHAERQDRQQTEAGIQRVQEQMAAQQEAQDLEARRGALMAKRFAGGLSTAETAEYGRLFARLAEREQEGQK